LEEEVAVAEVLLLVAVQCLLILEVMVAIPPCRIPIKVTV
jgi:hypothetical protein